MNNTSASVRGALTGTKTHENLKMAFLKEAECLAKESIYSSLASHDKNISAQRALEELCDNDRHHAELWLGYLDELGDTLENIDLLTLEKADMTERMYPLMAEIADEEGFEEIGEKFRLASAVKDAHKSILNEEAKSLTSADALYSDNPETAWKCTCCGYITKGNMPPERCPLCSYPGSYYTTA